MILCTYTDAIGKLLNHSKQISYVKSTSSQGSFDVKKFAFIYLNFGLLILDNIHFQYNSMMYGVMVLCLAYIHEVKLRSLYIILG